jgi:hypothetical protein
MVVEVNVPVLITSSTATPPNTVTLSKGRGWQLPSRIMKKFGRHAMHTVQSEAFTTLQLLAEWGEKAQLQS